MTTWCKYFTDMLWIQQLRVRISLDLRTTAPGDVLKTHFVQNNSTKVFVLSYDHMLQIFHWHAVNSATSRQNITRCTHHRAWWCSEAKFLALPEGHIPFVPKSTGGGLSLFVCIYLWLPLDSGGLWGGSQIRLSVAQMRKGKEPMRNTRETEESGESSRSVPNTTTHHCNKYQHVLCRCSMGAERPISSQKPSNR